MKTINIRVPATTANLGAGFDVFGMALSLYNELLFETDEDSSAIKCEIEGEGAEELTAAGTDNLVVRSMRRLADECGRPLPRGVLSMKNRIPLARGLGSSSAAIVGGLYLADRILGTGLSKQELLAVAVAIEGHPDNVAPALLGHCIASVQGDAGWETVSYHVPAAWKWVACVPQTPLSTAAARRALPATVAHADAVRNIGATTFFLSALVKENPQYLRLAFRDRLHVPYRLPLISGGENVLAAAVAAGAYAATISGSGSTLLAVCDSSSATRVAEAMAVAFGAEEGAQSFVLDVCTTGVVEI